MTSENTSQTNLLYQDNSLDTSISKCPNCGGEAVYSAKHQKMRCKYCKSLFEIENYEKVKENDIVDLINKGSVWKDTNVYQCKSCGAKAIFSKQEVTHTCAFCGTSNVIKTEELPGIKPQGIVPFKVDKHQASIIARKWAKKQIFAPNSFQKSAKAENIKGVYNPAFTFDSVTVSSYNGTLGKNYTTTHYVKGRAVTTTHTKYFKINGTHNANFDDLIVQASSNIPNNTLTKISPFPTNDAPKYKAEYLHGYEASTYSKDGNTCWQESQAKMKQQIEAQILKRYDYDIKASLNVATKFTKNTYKFILVPVYVGHYNFKQKLYNFYINGENGKMTGKSPISKIKVLLTCLAVILIIVGIFFLANLLAE